MVDSPWNRCYICENLFPRNLCPANSNFNKILKDNFKALLLSSHSQPTAFCLSPLARELPTISKRTKAFPLEREVYRSSLRYYMLKASCLPHKNPLWNRRMYISCLGSSCQYCDCQMASEHRPLPWLVYYYKLQGKLTFFLHIKTLTHKKRNRASTFQASDMARQISWIIN